MIQALLADVVLVLHGLFIVFALAGAPLVCRWPRLAWLHVPAAAWSAWVGATGWVCPLTILEVDLRGAAGQLPYHGGCIEHYVGGVVHPDGLTRPVQGALGAVLVLINVAVYSQLIRTRKRARN